MTNKRIEDYTTEELKEIKIKFENGKQYDFQIFSIVKYFQLCMENNPNMLDSLFTPVNCVIHSTQIGNLVRENRKMFLHKGCWPKLKGYAFSQLHKASIKEYKGLDDLTSWEKEHEIDNKTTFFQVEEELKRRKII